MPSPAGIENGTNALLIKLVGTEQLVIGALMSNGSAFNRALVEITNKSSDQFREYMTGDEGTKTADHSCECLYSTDVAYQAMRDAYFSGEIGKYFFVYDGAASDFYDFKVESFSDAANLNEAIKTAFSLKSSDEFSSDNALEDAIDSAADDAVDSNANAAVAPAI